MKYMFIGAAAAFMMIAPAVAQADDMTDSRYLAANTCVAYAELPQLEGDVFDVTNLKAAMREHRPQTYIRDRARVAARDVRTDGGDVAELRAERDQACASFISSGLASAAPAAPGA